ncbi:hypothetical protein [Streptomyces sp. NBC_00989]|uniref:hypothetical protein n=1 Tax=Streptomyces sp. NBC_00989 TaxID=2903705 RepID=UPI00386A8A47|nr:hypothetical protein OG714_47760 [Streptomyces sp. NBC_00989]
MRELVTTPTHVAPQLRIRARELPERYAATLSQARDRQNPRATDVDVITTDADEPGIHATHD